MLFYLTQVRFRGLEPPTRAHTSPVVHVCHPQVEGGKAGTVCHRLPLPVLTIFHASISFAVPFGVKVEPAAFDGTGVTRENRIRRLAVVAAGRASSRKQHFDYACRAGSHR